MTILQDRAKKVLTGLWHNQHGSEIDVNVHDDGRITGCFMVRLTDNEVGEIYTLSGFAREDLVTFCADFSKHGSMTAWVGQFTGDETQSFETMWHMVVDTYGDKEKSWKAVLSGSDRFVRGARPKTLAPAYTPASHPLYSGLI